MFLQGESFAEGIRVFLIFHCLQTFFWLVGGEVTGRCSRNLVLSLKLPSSIWAGTFVPTEELKDIVMYIPWRGTRTLPHHWTIVSLLLLLCFCIPSLPWWATIWIFPLELKEGQGGWSHFPTDKKWGTWKGFVPRRAPYGPAPFHFFNNFRAFLSLFQSMQGLDRTKF